MCDFNFECLCLRTASMLSCHLFLGFSFGQIWTWCGNMLQHVATFVWQKNLPFRRLVQQCLTGRRDEDDDVEPQLQVSENSWAAQQAKRQVRAADEVGGVGRGIYWCLWSCCRQRLTNGKRLSHHVLKPIHPGRAVNRFGFSGFCCRQFRVHQVGSRG